MRKIRLELGDLVVEGFATSRADGGTRGTVAARVSGDATECATLGIDPTCAFYASCDVGVECEGTVVNASCPNVSDC